MTAGPYNRGLHRWSILLAFCTLLLVVAGGLVTSREAGLSVPDWPLSYGQLMPPMEGGILYEHGHRMIATTVGLFTIVSMVWLLRAEKRRWMRWLGIVALAAVIVQGVLGGLTVLMLLPWWISLAHACLAQLFFSTTVALALFTSDWWIKGTVRVDEDPKYPLRALSLAAPIAVLVQLALGAAARHKAIGSIYHICASPIVTGVILWIALRILLHYADNRELRRGAVTLLAITFCQVFLGIAAFMSRIAYADAVQPMPVMVTFTVLHVAVGALTMASSVALAILVRRNLTSTAVEFSPRAGGRRFLKPMRLKTTLIETMRGYIALTKPRITWLILMSTGVGYFFGLKRDWSGVHDWLLLLNTLLGTGLIASGTAALNQWYEREEDCLMRRTAGRPLPAGRMSARHALWYGIALSVAGFAELAVFVNRLSGILGALTLLAYLFIYTPLKKRSHLSTVIGALPGAMPPLIGYAASNGSLMAEAWTLFAILFVWQFPHFLAIAWMYREDYARAGIRMLPVVEPDGLSTGRQIVLYASTLIPVSLFPALLGMSGKIYLAGALALGVWFLYTGVRVALDRTNVRARQVLLASVIYLPMIYGLMVFDRPPL
jgi:heme o synthase